MKKNSFDEPRPLKGNLLEDDNREETTAQSPSKTKKIILWIISILSILTIAVAGFLYFQYATREKQDTFVLNQKFGITSGLVASLHRDINKFVRYESLKDVSMEMNFINGTTNQTTNQVQKDLLYTDFAINVFNKEYVNSNVIKYEAYLVVVNMSIIGKEESAAYLGGFNIFDSEINDIPQSTEESQEDDFYDQLPIYKFSFFKNGTVIDVKSPMDVNNLIQINVEEILEKIIPSISENSYFRKNGKIQLRSGSQPGFQKVFEQNGKFTTLYQHECQGVQTKEMNFKGSKMFTDMKININNELSQVSKIQSVGAAQFVSELKKKTLIKTK